MKKRIMQIQVVILLLFLAKSNNAFGQAPTTIVNYDFNSGSSYATLTPTLATGINCSASSSEAWMAFTGAASGSSAFTSNPTAGSTIAMSNSSGTNTRYFSFILTGASLQYYKTFKIYFQAQRSATGAQLVTAQYKLNSGPFTNFGTMAPGNGSFAQSGVISLPSSVDNPTSSLEIRLYASGASATGTLRMDNFQVQGVPVPKLTIGSNGSQPSAANIYQNSNNNILQTFSITEGGLASATLTQVTIPLSGNYIGASDVNTLGLKLYANTTNNFNTATLISSAAAAATGSGESLIFNSLNYNISLNTSRFFWATADIKSSATINNTIKASLLSIANFQFNAGVKSGNVGAGNLQTIKGLTQLQNCGYNASSYGESIPANIIPGATSYEFMLVNSALSYTQTIVNPSGHPHLNLYLLPGLINNTTYTASVRYFDGNTWSAYGPACNLTTPVNATTQISAGYCGFTPASFSQIIFADNVSGATQYEYKLENAALNYTHTLVKPQSNFNLTQFTGLTNGATYSVSVRVFIYNAWDIYGPVCTIIVPTTAPTTSLSSSNCGITASSYTQILFADAVTGAAQYEYKLENAALSYTNSYLKTNNNFNLTQFPNLTNATTYSVSVRVIVNNILGAYGPVCTITTPANSPTTSLSAANCGITASSYTQILFANAVAGASQYEYRLDNATLSYSQSYAKPQANFNLSQFTGLAQNSTYNVQVRTFFNNAWGPYGSVCSITTPNTAPPAIITEFNNAPFFTAKFANDNLNESNDMGSVFDAMVYPNPYNEEFSVNLLTYNVHNLVTIKVFDATGKLIEQHILTPTEVPKLILGKEYANGIYNIVVLQGDQTKTIKTIKR